MDKWYKLRSFYDMGSEEIVGVHVVRETKDTLVIVDGPGRTKQVRKHSTYGDTYFKTFAECKTFWTKRFEANIKQAEKTIEAMQKRLDKVSNVKEGK